MAERPEYASLEAKLAARIAADGPLRLDVYMAACLTDEEFGYYLRADPLGRGGDFITAPEVSQIFGELIGLWCVVVWQQMGQPERLHLVELGPGRGSLMADALRAARIAPGFLPAVRLSFVEASPVLRRKQEQAVAPFALDVAWYDTLAEIRPLRRGEGGIILANEFLDVLPIRQFERHGGAWFERLVGHSSAAGLVMELADVPTAEAELPPVAGSVDEDGAVLEVCPALPGLISDMARFAARAPMAALVIDYGPARSAAGDSLQAVRGHAYTPILATPGEADLTAHVDFATVARLAGAAGFATYGPLSQGHFLLALGLQQRVRQLMKGKPLHQAQEIARAAARLVDPGQMGALFKALVLTRAIAQQPPPFDAVSGDTPTGHA